MATTYTNQSNNILSTYAIEGLFSLFEGDGIVDYWIANVTADLSDADKANIRRNFPRVNHYRDVIMKLAWSIPLPRIMAAPQETEEATDSLQAIITEMLERQCWEGQKDFWAAVPWWRCFVFVGADLFFKLPTDGKKVLPERMPAQYTMILLHPTRRKVINGYQFRYKVGSQDAAYTPTGSDTVEIVETVTPGKWTVTETGGEPEEQDVKALGPDEIAVGHLAWEEREDSPRGLPLGERLAEKFLHVLSCALDRRLGNKMGSVPMYVVTNLPADNADLPAVGPGAVWSIKTEVPAMPADVKPMQATYDGASQRSEYLDALREMYEEAFLPFTVENQGQQVSSKSGKAMQMLSSDQVKYRESFQTAEGSFLGDLIYKALKMEGHKLTPKDIVIQYDPPQSPDPTDRRADAQFYLDAGAKEEAFITMGKDEKEASKLVQALDDKAAEAMLGDKEGLDVLEEDEEVKEPKDKKAEK